MASVKTSITRSSSRSSSKLRGRSQHEEPEIFKRLWSIDWHNQPPNGATFASELSAKRGDGSTIIQTLLELEAPQNAVDEAIMGIIDQTGIAYLNVPGRGHETALYTAVRKKRPNVARKLLDKGCDVTIRNHEERVPVHAAAINGDVGLVASLLGKDQTVINTQDAEKLTPLDVACWQGQIEVVNFILSRDRGALQLTDKSGMTPLMTAVYHGRLDCCQALLGTEEGMCILNAGDDSDVTALDTACMNGNLEIVNFLLEKGAYKECRDAKGFTPFLTAATNNHATIAEKLIDSGCDVAAQTNEGDTAMIRAAFYGHEDIVNLLLRYESCLELVNMADNGGVTPLILASRHGWPDFVSILLTNGADQFKADQHSKTALMGASRWSHASIVRMLLQHARKLPDNGLTRILDHKSSDEAAFATIHVAAFNGHVEIIEILLEYGVDVDAVDSQQLNALHYVCRQGYLELTKILCKMTSDVNAVDKHGWTALHHAASAEYDKTKDLLGSNLGSASIICTPGRHIEIIHHLLQQPEVDPVMVTSEWETALHMACGRGFHLRVEALLGDPRFRIALPWESQHGRTPLGTAMSRQKLQVVRLLLGYVDSIEFGHTDDDDEDIMMWLATRTETHNDLRTILLSGFTTDMATFASWGALELAAYRGFPKLLWSLLHSTDPTPDRNERMRSMRPIVMNEIRRLRCEGGGGGTKGRFAVGKESKQEPVMEAADVSKKDPRFETVSKYEKVLRALQNPPMVDIARWIGECGNTDSRRKPTYEPHSAQMLDCYSACIMEFYQADRHHPTRRTGSSISSDVHVRFDTIRDLIYDSSPDELLDQARKDMQSIGTELGSGDTVGSDALTREAVQVRWFHLPANNMKWMKDLALVLMEGSTIDDDGLSWLDHSWDQVMGQSPWRFMKPKCAYRMAPGEKMTQMALYMPYLNLGIHDALPNPQRKMYEDLLEDYAARVIHGSHTLDEFYYHACVDRDIRQAILNQNADQVLSKMVHGPTSNLSWWALVNVHQIWVWVIDEKTIISSSTHKMDRADDPLITTVLDNLRQPHGTNHGRGSPTSAFQMAGQIVDACVGFYDRGLKLKSKQSDLSRIFPTNFELHDTIHDVFSNAISQATLRESSLYTRFASHEQEKRFGRIRDIMAAGYGKRYETIKAAKLFYEIKDIRHDVKMLKMVAEYQMQVQLDLNRANGKGSSDDSGVTSSEGITNRLKEMDKAAAHIEMAVNTTLTLEQNEMSISQSEEAVSQGKTLMLFTVVTIVFLPLSFFTSFFALDVASFSKTPPWAFLLLFCISFGICVPLVGYAFFSERLTQYYYRVRPSRHSVPTSPSQLDEKDDMSRRTLGLNLFQDTWRTF